MDAMLFASPRGDKGKLGGGGLPSDSRQQIP
jgi:hypothetical protein